MAHYPLKLSHTLLQCYILFASKQKLVIENSITKLLGILEKEKENVAVLVCLAVGYMLLKQPPRARNQLKRISKMDWNGNEAESFERGWLLLSDIYIQVHVFFHLFERMV